MKLIEDYLEKLDIYFGEKNERERYMMIIGIAAFVALIGYYGFGPIAEQADKNAEAQKKRVEKSLKEHQNYISGITKNGDKDHFVKEYDKQIKSKEIGIENYKNRIKHINDGTKKLSDMIFNKKSWSNFLDSITERAESNGIDIFTIANKFVDSNNSFGHVLEIQVSCQGNYKDILKFMNDIEQNRLVTDIYGSKIYRDVNSSFVNADINVSVWGVNH
ncbi:MAG: type 4a pilus biogenesis protein PilO [Campylobacterales bacterium]|nr:type 4a pilus biogenesis protein PilO [Campylobacterales bacterium]